MRNILHSAQHPRVPTCQFGIKEKVDGLAGRVLQLGEKVEGLDQRLGRVEASMIGGFVTMSAAMIAGFAALFTQL